MSDHGGNNVVYVTGWGEMDVADDDGCQLRSVSTTRVHGPSSRAELTARELGCIF